MSIGVDKFIGERLTEAREARGILTMSSLADLLEVSKNTISLCEANKTKPRAELVEKMAEKLTVKESFFFMPLPDTQPRPVFQRSRHALTKHHRTVAERKFGWAKYLIDVYLKSYLDMPELNVPQPKELGVPDNPEEITVDDIERIAMHCREFWGMGYFPIENITTLLENNGIFVTAGLTHSDKLDAFSNISEYDGSFHIFLGLDKNSVARSRYDAAHELGHLVLHSHLANRSVNDRTHALIEDQANRFAGAFLMPKYPFANEVWMLSIEAFKVLKKDWKASVGAIIKRCDDLGLFVEDEARLRQLWIKYRKDWRNIEADVLSAEPPQLTKRSIDVLLESGIISKQQILHELPFSQNDIESLLNLPPDYLSEDFGELRHFPQIKQDLVSGQTGSGHVFSFEDRRRTM
jgi:Zn-dependent peptidase ImmA (M78 family)/transcriptional regulator with XRE-family HTH domain